MKLVYKKTGNPVKVGDKINMKIGGKAEVTYFAKPHKPSSEGKVSIKYQDNSQSEFYVGVIGAEWIEREDRDEEINTPQDFVTREIAMDSHYRQEFYHREKRNADGSAMRVRVNGKCKTWETRPGDFQLPVKYGLKECGYITHRDNVQWLVKDPTAKLS